MLKLTNYLDLDCAWGYTTLCKACKPQAPNNVYLNRPLKGYMPGDHCSICKKPGKVVVITEKCPDCGTTLDGDIYDYASWHCPDCEGTKQCFPTKQLAYLQDNTTQGLQSGMIY